MKRITILVLIAILIFACDKDDEQHDELINFYPDADAPFDVPVLEWGKDSFYVKAHTSKEYIYKRTTGDINKHIHFSRVEPKNEHFFDYIEYIFSEGKLISCEIFYSTFWDDGNQKCREYFLQKLGKGINKDNSVWITKKMDITIYGEKNKVEVIFDLFDTN